MAATTAANRKRKAQEADINTPPTNDSKRVKICGSDQAVDSVRSTCSAIDAHASSNGVVDCNSEPTDLDAFQSFADSTHNTGFSALLNQSHPHPDQPEPSNATFASKENSLSSMSIKSNSEGGGGGGGSGGKDVHKHKSPSASTCTKNILNDDDDPAAAAAAVSAFDAFIHEAKHSNAKDQVAFSWGNQQGNEFKFDSKASEFSFSELATNTSPHKIASAATDDAAAPVANLHGMVDAGDQHDVTLFEIRCKIWQFSASDTQWHEKGIGVVKVNSYSTTQAKKGARLLCRTDVTFKTLINAVIKHDTTFSKLNDDRVKFTVLEQAQEQPPQQALRSPKSAKGEADADEDDEEEEDDDVDAQVVVVTKTYLLRSKEADKTKIDAFLAKLKQIQNEM